jgi:hypothetical protein
MVMTVFRITLASLFLVISGVSVAQEDPGNVSPRGSIPLGTSRDGSRPSDGAIQGGAIAPGERGGIPDGLPRKTTEEQRDRCRELAGALRDQCLRDLDVSTGNAPSNYTPPRGTGLAR